GGHPEIVFAASKNIAANQLSMGEFFYQQKESCNNQSDANVSGDVGLQAIEYSAFGDGIPDHFIAEGARNNNGDPFDEEHQFFRQAVFTAAQQPEHQDGRDRQIKPIKWKVHISPVFSIFARFRVNLPAGFVPKITVDWPKANY